MDDFQPAQVRHCPYACRCYPSCGCQLLALYPPLDAPPGPWNMTDAVRQDWADSIGLLPHETRTDPDGTFVVLAGGVGRLHRTAIDARQRMAGLPGMGLAEPQD
jgi:hypothetical protein